MAEANIVIPSLSIDGNITDPNEILAKQFQYFLAADYSQSNIFYAKVASLKTILADNKLPTDVKSAIESALTKLYMCFFDTVVVTVTIDDTTSVVKYFIKVQAYLGNNSYDMNTTIDSSLANMTNYNEALSYLLEKYKPL